MKDLKRFLSFVGKEFCHILRDTRTLMVLIAMPVIMIVLFGFALSTELKDVKVAVCDLSKDAASSEIMAKISASPYFKVSAYVNNAEEINRAFLKGEADAAIVFEDNFYQRVLHDGHAGIQIIADGTNTNTGTMSVVYLSNIIGGFIRELAEERAMDMQGEASAGNVPIRIDTSSHMLYNPQMKSAFNFVPGVMGMIFMLVSAMMTSVSIVREKERGTMEVLLVSPVKPFAVILAKTIPYFVVSAFNLVVIICLSVFLLKVPVSGSLLWLVAVTLLFILVSLSIGILISTLVSKQEIAILISGVVLMLPTMLLSGMLFPIESMPEALQWFSCLIPAKWYIESMKMIMIQGLGIRYCLEHVLILCGFLAATGGASIIKFKDRL